MHRNWPLPHCARTAPAPPPGLRVRTAAPAPPSHAHPRTTASHPTPVTAAGSASRRPGQCRLQVSRAIRPGHGPRAMHAVEVVMAVERQRCRRHSSGWCPSMAPHSSSTRAGARPPSSDSASVAAPKARSPIAPPARFASPSSAAPPPSPGSGSTPPVTPTAGTTPLQWSRHCPPSAPVEPGEQSHQPHQQRHEAEIDFDVPGRPHEGMLEHQEQRPQPRNRERRRGLPSEPQHRRENRVHRPDRQ